MILGLPLVIAAAVADPRPAITERVVRGESAAALEAIDATLARDPGTVERLGLDYLRADLLERLGRTEEAERQLAAIPESSPLAAWVRLRRARLARAAGDASAATRLATSLLDADAGATLRREAVDLLRRALEGGGDCRSLDAVSIGRARGRERRELELVTAECAERSGQHAVAAAAATRLLERATDDAMARDAAELLARATLERGRTPRERLLLARTAFEHREFAIARALFLELLGDGPLSSRAWDDGYALARSEFWLAEHESAARRFDRLAAVAPSPRSKADALFQAGRSWELAARLDLAALAFEGARAAEPLGTWSGVAQLASLRLRAQAGDEAGAETLARTLATRRSWRDEAARGALFLASGRLARGEPRGVEPLLDLAGSGGAARLEEVAYWRGRLAELEGSHARAVATYLEALEVDPFLPFGGFAARRLASETLAPATRARSFALARGATLEEQRAAALLLGSLDEGGPEAERAGRARLAAQPGAAAWLDWRPVPASSWPVFMKPPRAPGDLLVALGRLEEAPRSVRRWFPLADPALAFTGASALAAAGDHREALALVETLFDRRPATVPIEWVDPALRRQLYPLPFGEILRDEASRRGVDPSLLAAIVREESRFDPEAISPASARGLAQFVVSTARRLARALDLPEPLPRDLDRPELSLALGAGYLAELAERFGHHTPAMVAAYNAGEVQTELWLRYCSTQEEAEFLSKVGFRETRAYLHKVLGSHAHYRALEEPARGKDGLSAAATLR